MMVIPASPVLEAATPAMVAGAQVGPVRGVAQPIQVAGQYGVVAGGGAEHDLAHDALPGRVEIGPAQVPPVAQGCEFTADDGSEPVGVGVFRMPGGQNLLVEYPPCRPQRAGGLLQRQVEVVVVLEATSDYWRYVYYTLQESLNLMLVNPAHLRGIRGRKTDPSDAAFLARAGASGMVIASFVPPRTIRELRDLTRRRTELAVARGQEVQRLEKELEDTGMKLTSVISDVQGVTGRAIVAALIAGSRDPQALADLAVGSARRKIPALVDALDGTFTDHHAFMCRHYLDQLDHLDTLVAALDTRIAALVKEHDHDQDLKNLDTIPGIGPTAAEIIIAETGADMATFATAAHLASWIGVCPGLNESAGISKSGKTRNGNANLKRVLGVAAMSAIRRKDSYYNVYYRRVAARRGGKRALVAVMHKITISIWHMLHDKTVYHDLGSDYFIKRDPERAMRRMQREANTLGLTIRFDPITQTA